MIYSDNIHIISDTSTKELHDFAKKIGLDRRFFSSLSGKNFYFIPAAKLSYLEKYEVPNISSEDLLAYLSPKEKKIEIRQDYDPEVEDWLDFNDDV